MENNIYNNSINSENMEKQQDIENDEEKPALNERQKTKAELIKDARVERLAKAREKLREMQEAKKSKGEKREFEKNDKVKRFPDIPVRKIKDLTPEEKKIDAERRLKAQIARNQEKEEIKKKKLELREYNIRKMEEEEEEQEILMRKAKRKPVYIESSDDDDDDEIEEEPRPKSKSKINKNKPLKKISIKYYHEPSDYEINQDQLMIQREQQADLEKIKYKENQKKINEENQNKKNEISQFDKLKKLMMSGEDY